jgi:competence protein ComEC
LDNLGSLQYKKLSSKLLRDRREWSFFLLFTALLLLSSLSKEYLQFLNFTKFSTADSEIFVLNQYLKKDYFVLKVVDRDGFEFYTITKERVRDLRGYSLSVTVQIGDNFTFLDYLRGGFLFIRDLELSSWERSLRYRLADEVEKMHPSEKIGKLYSALFFATPIGGELREDLTRLGINHLAVLSGFHVSSILLGVFLLSRLFYYPLHRRYFPYRNRFRDTLIFSLSLVILYLIFLDYPPSFLRAVGMALIGAYLFDRNLLKAPFETLIFTVLLLLSLEPTLLFSAGFLFSVSGVFYILLYLQIFKFGKYLDLVFLNFWVFFAMVPIVHTIFDEFYLSQLLSPLWTTLFIVFYPISIGVHLLGFGDILDPLLLEFLDIEFGGVYRFQTPIFGLGVYIILSLAIAVKYSNFSGK